jgi:antirestriction protein ArdC
MHEAAHASGAEHRLDRRFGERFTCHTLAIEECTAELTASYILADLGVAHHPRPDHASYVASWSALKDDRRAISRPPARPGRPPTGCTHSTLG